MFGTLAALALSSLAYAAPATAAPGDTVTVSNELELRRAVFRANQGRGPSNIKLDSNIKLSRDGSGGAFRGDIDIISDITIAGAGNFIDAQEIDRHFDISTAGSLTMFRILLVNGAPDAGENGGAIRNLGDLTIRNSRLLKNDVSGTGASGGAISSEGADSSLTVVTSRVNRNSAVRAGGAIEVDGGTAFIRQSRMAGNDAGDGPGNGGALHITGEGEVQVVASIVRNNDAVEGGGLWNSSTGALVVRRTDVQNNTATGTNSDGTDAGGGGLYNDGGDLVVRASTVEGNEATGDSASGGGVLNKGTLTTTTTVFTGNSATRAGGGIEGGTDSVNSIDGAVITGNSVATNPGNGGGAHFAGGTETVVTGTQVLGNTAGSEGGGLWTAGSMLVDNSEVSGNTASGDAAENGGGGLYNDGGDIDIMNSTVGQNDADGTSGSGGGFLNNGGTLMVTETSVEDNVANRAGGGIEAAGGTTTVRRSSLVDNSIGDAAPGNGGGMHIGGDGVSTVNLSLVSGNTAVEGGGLWNSGDGDMTVRRSEVSGNEATGSNAEGDTDAGGGGIYNDGGTLLVGGAEVSGNSATGESASGGGLLNNGGQVEVRFSTFDGNDATRAGGGIETAGDDSSTVTVTSTDITNNTTGDNPGNGGGIHIGGAAQVTLDDDVNVTDNTATNEGGGVWVNGSSTDEPNQFNANGANITNNTPDDVYYNGDDQAFVDGAPVDNTDDTDTTQ